MQIVEWNVMGISTLTCMFWSNLSLEKRNNSWISSTFWEISVVFQAKCLDFHAISPSWRQFPCPCWSKCIKISSTIRIASFDISAKFRNLPSPYECCYICSFIASLCSLADLLLYSRCWFICFHSVGSVVCERIV